MKLAISNIAWTKERDNIVYDLMKQYGYSGLEIAPTRIIPEKPYEKIESILAWKNTIYEEYGFVVPSMQSIWFGKQEKIFGSTEERKELVSYTKTSINFAETINCKNLVFGCPKNRVKPEGADVNIAIDFFREIGDYAFEHNSVIGMEANPPIYNTNFINYTEDAIALIKSVNSKGFKLNLDIGTMIENDESVMILNDNVDLINHVHISEPGLKIINYRKIHHELYKLLYDNNYDGFISIEMGKVDNISDIERVMKYIADVFI